MIPTFNRREVLVKTLLRLDLQDCDNFDVVVVDDGSTDDSAIAVETLAPRLSYPVTLLRQPNQGPASARNRGIAAARGKVTLLIGDDTLPEPDLVRHHAEHHATHPDVTEAALGYTPWCEENQRVTPYMHWVGLHGIQFDYAHLLAGGAADWRHFYTSNLSLKTAHLRANPFSEEFPAAAVEDIELGRRLDHKGALRMSFLPDAIARHVHPMTFRQGCQRQEKVGRCWRLFDRLQQNDEYKERLLAGGRHHWASKHRWALPVLAWLGELSLALRCPNGFAARVLDLHSRVGYFDAVTTE